jgi:hypothetical protein
MGRLVVALDADVGVSPEELAAAWEADAEARAVGEAAVEPPPHQEYLADVLALVVVPLLVNLASSAAYDLVCRLVARAAAKNHQDRPGLRDLEMIQIDRANGDRILVVRRHEDVP